MSGVVERRECCLCGATEVQVRFELFRYLEFAPGHEWDAGWRCVDRDQCKADVDAVHALDPKNTPRWNVADAGVPAVSRPRSPWGARAGEHARQDPPEVPAPPSAPDQEPRAFADASVTTGSQLEGLW